MASAWQKLERRYAFIFNEWKEKGLFTHREISTGENSFLKIIKAHEHRLIQNDKVVTDFTDYIADLINIENQKCVKMSEINKGVPKEERVMLDEPGAMVRVIHEVFTEAITFCDFDFSLRKTHLAFTFHSGGGAFKAMEVIQKALSKTADPQLVQILCERYLQEGDLESARMMYLKSTLDKSAAFPGDVELLSSYLRMEVKQLHSLAEARLSTKDHEEEHPAPGAGHLLTIFEAALDKVQEAYRPREAAASESSSDSSDSSSSDSGDSSEGSEDSEPSPKGPAPVPRQALGLYSALASADAYLSQGLQRPDFITGLEAFRDGAWASLQKGSDELPLLALCLLSEQILSKEISDPVSLVEAFLEAKAEEIKKAEDLDEEASRTAMEELGLLIEWLINLFCDSLWRDLDPKSFAIINSKKAVSIKEAAEGEDSSSDIEIFADDTIQEGAETAPAAALLDPVALENSLFPEAQSAYRGNHHPYGRVLGQLLKPYASGSQMEAAFDAQGSGAAQRRLAKAYPRLSHDVRRYLLLHGILSPPCIKPSGQGIESRLDYPNEFRLSSEHSSSTIELAMGRRAELAGRLKGLGPDALDEIVTLANKMEDYAEIKKSNLPQYERVQMSINQIVNPAKMLQRLMRNSN